MTRNLFPFAVLATMTIIVTGAAAQRNEIGGIIGRAFISDQGVSGTVFTDSNIHFGHGLTFEANFSRRLVNAGVFGISFEIPVVIDPSQKLHFSGGVTPNSFTSYFITPSARLHLVPNASVSPWISVGGGFGRFAYSSRLESGQPNPNKSGTTAGAVQLGLGLDVKIIHSVYLRGEVREFYAGEPRLNVITGKSRYYNLFSGAGVVWRF